MIKCKRCGYDKDKSKIELHHIIQKTIGGTDRDGRVHLCGKCHAIIHGLILNWIWYFIAEDTRTVTKQSIQNKTGGYVKFI